MRLFWTVAALLVLAGGITFGVMVGVHKVNATTMTTTTICHPSDPFAYNAHC